MSPFIAIAGIWILCGVWTYIIYARNFWARFGDVLGWKPSDTAFGIIISAFGPIGLVGMALGIKTDEDFTGLPNLGAPFFYRLPRDPTFIKYYFD